MAWDLKSEDPSRLAQITDRRPRLYRHYLPRVFIREHDNRLGPNREGYITPNPPFGIVNLLGRWCLTPLILSLPSQPFSLRVVWFRSRFAISSPLLFLIAPFRFLPP